MRPAVVVEIARTTLREFVRTKEAVFWTYGFPVLIAVVLGLAFGSDSETPLRVAVAEGPHADALASALEGDEHLQVEVRARTAAEHLLDEGRTELVIGGTPERPELVFDPRRMESRLARAEVGDALQRAAGRRDVVPVHEQPALAATPRYIDFLIPGLMGLNLLGAGLFGVGFNLVDMRTRHLLRRLVVAPMHRSEFLLGFLVSRLGLVVLDGLLILGFGMLAFGVPMQGSWPALLLLLVVGGLAFSGLGLVVASRPRTVEAVSGLMNLVMLPMWLFCGIFFRTTYFPDWLQPFIQALPLTQANQALRTVMLDGGGLASVGGELLYLVVFTVLAFAVALRIFRWT